MSTTPHCNCGETLASVQCPEGHEWIVKGEYAMEDGSMTFVLPDIHRCDDCGLWPENYNFPLGFVDTGRKPE